MVIWLYLLWKENYYFSPQSADKKGRLSVAVAQSERVQITIAQLAQTTSETEKK